MHGGLDTAGGAHKVDVEIVLPAFVTHITATSTDVWHKYIQTAELTGSAGDPALVGGLVGHVDNRACDLNAFGAQLADGAINLRLVA